VGQGELHGMLENILETEEGKAYKDLSQHQRIVSFLFKLQIVEYNASTYQCANLLGQTFTIHDAVRLYLTYRLLIYLAAPSTL
jgi:hypothetical protein